MSSPSALKRSATANSDIPASKKFQTAMEYLLNTCNQLHRPDLITMFEGYDQIHRVLADFWLYVELKITRINNAIEALNFFMNLFRNKEFLLI